MILQGCRRLHLNLDRRAPPTGNIYSCEAMAAIEEAEGAEPSAPPPSYNSVVQGHELTRSQRARLGLTSSLQYAGMSPDAAGCVEYTVLYVARGMRRDGGTSALHA